MADPCVYGAGPMSLANANDFGPCPDRMWFASFILAACLLAISRVPATPNPVPTPQMLKTAFAHSLSPNFHAITRTHAHGEPVQRNSKHILFWTLFAISLEISSTRTFDASELFSMLFAMSTNLAVSCPMLAWL